jgi:hypothetical protein
MYVFSIDITFKDSRSLAKMTSKVTAVSYLHSGVNDSAVHGLVFVEKIDFVITAESMTPLCRSQRSQ